MASVWYREDFRDRKKFVWQCRSATKKFRIFAENCSECRKSNVLIDGIIGWLESRGWPLRSAAVLPQMDRIKIYFEFSQRNNRFRKEHAGFRGRSVSKILEDGSKCRDFLRNPE
jgi:hypothetical protein